MLKAVAMFLLGFVCAAAVAMPAIAQGVSGHYVLRGVMEVGSELMLKPDGSFEYMLAYGAADIGRRAHGRRTATPSSCIALAKKGRHFGCCEARPASPAGSASGCLARMAKE